MRQMKNMKILTGFCTFNENGKKSILFTTSSKSSKFINNLKHAPVYKKIIFPVIFGGDNIMLLQSVACVRSTREEPNKPQFVEEHRGLTVNPNS